MPINQPRSRRSKSTTATAAENNDLDALQTADDSLAVEACALDSYSENHTRLCNLCGKAFQTESGLRSHLKAHNANENFRCQICAKTMRTPQTFQVGLLYTSV